MLGRLAGAAVGDLLGEVVAAAEFLAQDLDDGFGVVVVLGEDQGLGQFRALREEVALPVVAQGAGDGADLVGRLHAAVEFFGRVFEVVVELPVAAGAGFLVAHFQPVAGLDLAARLGDFGADAIDVVIDVHAVGHGLLVAVFHHQVLVEEAEGLLVGRGGEADQMGVEIFEHLAPQVVDGAVRLVGDDDVEGLDGDGRVVGDGLGFLEEAFDLFGGVFVVFIGQLAALEHGVHALDGADGDARRGVEGVAGEVLDDVFLAEFVVVVGRDELVEFLLGLAAEVGAIDQEQHAPGAGKLDQPVDEVDGGVGLAAARGHLDQRARLVGGQRLFQVVDGLDLGGPEAGFDQRRHGFEAGEKSRRWLGGVMSGGSGGARIAQPLGQGVGLVESKDAAGARRGVEAVGEVGLDAGGFVEEGQGPAPGGKRGRQALGVLAGLDFDAGKGGAQLLGLDDAGGLAVEVEQVVGKAAAGFEREFAQRHAAGGVDVGLGDVENLPACRIQQAVDLLPCLLFRLRHAAVRSQVNDNGNLSMAWHYPATLTPAPVSPACASFPRGSCG